MKPAYRKHQYDGVVRFQRLYNFRDLSSASSTNLLYGKVARCANPVTATYQDVNLLLHVFKIRTLIDLRDAEEAATVEDNANLLQHFVTVDAEENPMPTFKTRRLVGAGMSEISKRPELKLINERILKIRMELGPQEAIAAMDMAVFMTILLDTQPRFFRKVLNIISRRKNHPCLFYCSAGRDRTGCVSMLVLKVCGATDDEIVQDYLKSRCLASGENVFSQPFKITREQHEYFEKNGFGDDIAQEDTTDVDDLDKAMDSFFMQLHKQDMVRTIDHIIVKYGSFEKYFDFIGFYEVDRKRLKNALTTYHAQL